MQLSEKYHIHPFSTPIGRNAYYADEVRPIMAALEATIENQAQTIKECHERTAELAVRLEDEK